MGFREDMDLIRQIASRGARLYNRVAQTRVSAEFIEQELRIVHEEICRLRLAELLAASEADFLHDVAGIHNHLDILDGRFRNEWTPRFAK